MTLCISNPVGPGDDIAICSALGLCVVKPVSRRGKSWFKKNCGSIKPQFLVADVEGQVADSFVQLNLHVVFNPISDTSEIRKIVSERLSYWRKSQIVT